MHRRYAAGRLIWSRPLGADWLCLISAASYWPILVSLTLFLLDKALREPGVVVRDTARLYGL